LKVLDEKIQKVNGTKSITLNRPRSNDWDIEEQEPASNEEVVIKERFGIVMQHQPTIYPYISFNVVKGEVNEEGTSFLGKVEKIDLVKFITPNLIKEEDKILLQLVQKITTCRTL